MEMVASDIPNSSAYPNLLSSVKIRMADHAAYAELSYIPNMPKKRTDMRTQVRTQGPNWFLPEWMKTLRIKQADLVRSTDWSPATVNDIYHGRTEYYRGIVNTVADVLNIKPFELMMHPDDAMAIRRLRESALTIAADRHVTFAGEGAEERKAG